MVIKISNIESGASKSNDYRDSTMRKVGTSIRTTVADKTTTFCLKHFRQHAHMQKMHTHFPKPIKKAPEQWFSLCVNTLPFKIACK